MIKEMKIVSPSFLENESIPKEFTCDGENMSPELRIEDAPEGTKSFALIMDDPDATGGKIFTHWLLWNISGETEVIQENEAPGIQGKNDFGNFSYGGPCPRPGKPHHYHFRLFALSETLELPRETSKEALEEEMKSSILDEAEFVGIYAR